MAAQKSLSEEITFKFSIALWGEPDLLVKKGEVVSSGQVVAKIKKITEEKIDLIKTFNIKGKKGLKFLVKGLGDEVKKGELVALKKGLLGTKKVYAALSGKLDSLSEDGVLRIRSFSEKEVKTDFAGKITKASAEELIVEFPALEIKGAWGIGKKSCGVLETVAKDQEGEDVFKIRGDVLGKILVVSGKVSKAFWFKALSLGVAGIICGNLGKGDLRKLLIQQQSIIEKERKNGRFPPLIVMADQEKSQAVWEQLKKHLKKRVLIDGEGARLIIPV